MRNLVIDWGERLILLVLFAIFALVNIRSGDPVNALFLVGEGLTAYFVLTRRRAISVTEKPADWALALGGTMLPSLARPDADPTAPWFAAALIIAGTLIAISAKLSLNRRFGIAPANRGVQAGWSYSLVRHPMYLGYMIAQVGYLLHNPTLRNLAVFAVAWLLQLGRIVREEDHLMQDDAYKAYAARVRHRLVPGLY